MAKEQKIIPIYKAEAFLIPVKYLSSDDIDKAKEQFTYRFYDDKKCAKCENAPDRHNDVCDACDAFKGIRRTAKIVQKGERDFLSLPVGASKKVKKWLIRTGHADHYKVKERFPERTPFRRRIKMIRTPYDYQLEAASVMLKKKRGILKSAPRTGKCIVGDSLIMSDYGIQSIDSLFTDLPLSETKESIFKTTGLSIASFKGSRDVAHLYSKIVDKTIKITTHYGYEIHGTPNHPVQVVGEDFKLAWKELQDIRQNDFLVVSRKQQWTGSGDSLFDHSDDYRLTNDTKILQKFPKKMTIELARLLGYWVANGSLNVRGCLNISTNNLEVQDDFIRCVRKVFPKMRCVARSGVKGCAGEVQAHSVQVASFLKDACGLTFDVAKGKSIPSILLSSDRKFFLEFLGAYTTCDAWVHTGGIQYTSASKMLMKQLHVCLTYLGVVGRFRSSRGCATNGSGIVRSYYSIFTSVAETNKLLKLIDLRRNVNVSKATTDVLDIIPNGLTNLTRFQSKHASAGYGWKKKNGKSFKTEKVGKLRLKRLSAAKRKGHLNRNQVSNVNTELMQWLDPKAHKDFNAIINPDLFFTQVTSIKIEKKPVRVYDVEVPKGHHFIANGLVNHNTVMATDVICRIGSKTLIFGSQLEWLKQFRATFIGVKDEQTGEWKKAPFTNARPNQIKICKTLKDFQTTDICLCTFSQFMSKKSKILLEQVREMFTTIAVDECFTKDHEVKLADGSYVPIATLLDNWNGTEVLSFNHMTGVEESKPVISSFSKDVTQLVKLRIDGEEFKCSLTHPFWSESRLAYVLAKDLLPGEKVRKSQP